MTTPGPVPSLDGRVLARDRGLVVVDKPAGLPSTGKTLEDPFSAQFALGALLGHPVWAVHQLDAETSGVNVFVERANLVARWQARMRFPRGRKLYLAIVDGVIAKDSVRVDAPIAADPVQRRQVVAAHGRPALSLVEVVARGVDTCAVRVEIRTGRTHQVRVHLAHIGHPLVGERRYRDVADTRLPRHALHAHRLLLDDGTVFDAPIPDDLRALATTLGLDLSAMSPST